MSNITYVSFLFSSPNDKVSLQQRVEWLQPLLDAKLPLILFLDDIYASFLGALPDVKIMVVEHNDLKTILTINAASAV